MDVGIGSNVFWVCFLILLQRYNKYTSSYSNSVISFYCYSLSGYMLACFI